MINLLLAIHNHQPVGNFEHVFKQAFKECYWPFLETIACYPDIKIALHHSGPLLDWAKKNEPNYIPTLVKLAKGGQIEPLGGGYYEPILAVIPPRDAAGQIRMMQDFWESEAGCKPRGIWTTERIWEPSLTTLLAENGIEYTILDDEHFRAAGVTSDPICNYYITERHGRMLRVFPSDQTLRYQIPFKLPEDVVANLTALAAKCPGSSITYGDDGEKFGMWPGTFEWVVKKGWLKKFFSLLTEHKTEIITKTISKYMDSSKPSGTVYLPTCSYHEMGEWAMPAEAINRMEGIKQFLEAGGKWAEAKPFLRGGYWDNFLTKYPEANYMHKRMLYVSDKLQKTKNKKQGTINEATGALYRAQCNCAYWHGLFGGLYLNYLRDAVFKNLLEAENLLDDATDDRTKIEKIDIDCDSNEEVILANKYIIAVVKPNHGAGLVELSHRRACLNLRNVLSRREEAYHKKGGAQVKMEQGGEEIPSIHNISKNPSQVGDIIYDRCDRLAFCDHIWSADSDPTTVTPLNIPFEISSLEDDRASFFARRGGLSIEKAFKIGSKADLKVGYKLKWDAPQKDSMRFGTALNLTLLAGHDESRYYLTSSGARELMDKRAGPDTLDKLSLVDEYSKFRLDIISSRVMDVWRYPIHTVSQSESGFDLLYQGSCIIWGAILPRGAQEMEFEVQLKFTEI